MKSWEHTLVPLSSYRELQEALEFYADESRYAPPVGLPGGIMQDRGARARAALSAHTEEERDG